MEYAAGLLGNGLSQFWVRMPQSAHSDSSVEVNIALAIEIPKRGPLAMTHHQRRLPVVRVKRCLSLLDQFLGASHAPDVDQLPCPG